MPEVDPLQPDVPRDVPPQASGPSQAPHGHKRRRRWLIAAAAAILGVAALVALAPTLLSTSWGRSLVLKWINRDLDGQIEVSRWSLAWWGGTHVDGLRIVQDGQPILQIRKLDTQLRMWDLVRGDYSRMGRSNAQDVNFVLREYLDGSTNFSRLTGGSSESSGLPNVGGDFTANLRGRIEQEQASAPPRIVIVEPSTVSLAMADINGPIRNRIELVAHLENGPVGRLSTNGTVDAFEEGRLDLSRLTADQVIEATSFDLAGLLPLFPPDGTIAELRGQLTGRFTARVPGPDEIVVEGSGTSANFAIGGPALKEDVYRTQQLRIEVPHATYNRATGRFRIGDPAASAQGGSLPPDGNSQALVLRSGDGTIRLTADATTSAMWRLADNQAPGEAGQLSVSIDASLPGLLPQLPHLLQMRPGVRVESGRLVQSVGIVLAPQQARLISQFQVTGLAGRNANGQAIAVQPVRVRVDATTLGGNGAVPDLRDIRLLLDSGFARVNGAGPTLAQLSVDGSVQLARVQQELGQFLDLGSISLAGDATFAVHSSGDLTTGSGSAKVTANASVTNLRIAGASVRPIHQERVELRFNGTLARSPEAGIEFIRDAAMSVRSPWGNATLNDADVRLAGNTGGGGFAAMLQMIQKGRLAIDLPDIAKAQASFAGDAQQQAAVRAVAGRLSGTFELAHSDRGLRISTKDLRGTGIVLAGKNSRLEPRDLSLALEAHVVPDFRGEGWQPGGLFRQVRIGHLAGSFGTDQIQLGEPIVLKKEGSSWSGEGAVRVAGQVRTLDQLVALARGESSAGGYTGTYTATERLVSREQKLELVGQVDLRDLAGSAKGKEAQPIAPLLRLVHDVSVDPAGQVIAIRSLSLEAPQTQMLHVALRGNIRDYSEQRIFEGMQATVSYDAAKLLQTASALVGPEEQAYLKRLSLEGIVKDRVFPITGKFPAFATAGRQPIQDVTVRGSLWFDRMTFEGMRTQHGMELPIDFSNGHLRTIYAGRAGEQRFGEAIDFNGGKLRVTGLDFTVVGRYVRVTSMVPEMKMFENVDVTPQFVDWLLGPVQPIFTGTQEARGKISLTATELSRLPLDAGIERSGTAGRATFRVSLVKLALRSPMTVLLGSQIGMQTNRDGTVTCNMRDARFELKDGRFYSDLSLDVGGQSIGFRNGQVVLRDNRIISMTMVIPKKMIPGARDQALVRDLIEVPVKGTLNRPEFDILAAATRSVDPMGALDLLRPDRRTPKKK